VELVERTWKHPTGKQPEIVHLVCLGPSHHDFDQGWLQPDTPEHLARADEVWAINRGVFHHQHDLHWCMDYIEGEANKWPWYGARLWNHDRWTITSERADGWPAHVLRYPFEEIYTWIQAFPKVKWTDCHGIERETGGAPSFGDWWINSVPFVLAYAAWIGVKKLNIWGGDYHHHNSGRVEDGHPNVAAWAAWLDAACGMKVWAPPSSTFMDTNLRGHIYGYPPHLDPRPHATAKRAAFRRLAGIDKGETDG